VAPNESSSEVGLRRRCVPFVRRRESQTVVWLSGDHDLLTVAALSETLARAFALDDADVVLDLSGVRFMGAATVDVVVRAKDLLDLRSRALTLRSPSESAQRVIDLCGLADLVDPSSGDALPLVGTNVGR
jgi:anti-sigma B factor antagonist